MEAYDNLKAAILNAGFFSAPVEDMGSWDRIVVATKRFERGEGLGGNSFWVTNLKGKWYLGTWSGYYYSASSFDQLCKFVLRALAEDCNTTIKFAPSLCDKFEISEIDCDEFSRFVTYLGDDDSGQSDLARAKESFEEINVSFESGEWYTGEVVYIEERKGQFQVCFNCLGQVLGIHKFDRITITPDRLLHLLSIKQSEK